MPIDKKTAKKPWYKELHDFVDGILQVFFRILTKIILGGCYFTVFAVTAILVKLVGKKLIPAFTPHDTSYWMEKEKLDLSLEKITRQG